MSSFFDDETTFSWYIIVKFFQGGLSMATSSITHNFVISTQNGVNQFISAVEAAEKENPQKKIPLKGRILTSPQEIRELMNKRIKNAR